MKFLETYKEQPIQGTMEILGRHQTGVVTINALQIDPADSQALINHSPDGFAWGYTGSGPNQLALALLMVAGVPDEDAIRLHNDLCRDLVAQIPGEDDFRMRLQSVRNWVNAFELKSKNEQA